MGKLILRLPGGATREIPLERERLTIGRRADNDICLPYPAVSAEHAAIVTILDDSFLEDLKSTNGTLVNGKPIAKHFLRDHDEIDIGRQVLVYFSGEYSSAMLEAALPPREWVDPLPAERRDHLAGGEASFMLVEGTTLSPVVPESVESATIDTGARFAPSPREQGRASKGSDARAEAVESLPLLEVLDGASAGQRFALGRDEFVIGRVGAQIAAIRSAKGGHRLFHLEGKTPPRLNGAALPELGALLASGDEIEIAGTRIAYRSAS